MASGTLKIIAFADHLCYTYIMDIIGETVPLIDARGRKRGTKTWVTCPVCEQGRWVRADTIKLKSFTGMCIKCHNKFTSGSMENHPQWKGSTKSGDGYKIVRLKPDSFFYPMAKKNSSVFEHRLIMAQHLKRCLLSWEVVHHKNGIPDDNRIENLQLLPSQTKHLPSMVVQNMLSRLERQVALLQEENVKLRVELDNLRNVARKGRNNG